MAAPGPVGDDSDVEAILACSLKIWSHYKEVTTIAGTDRVWAWLHRRWCLDPVRAKNLEKICSFLDSIAERLSLPHDAADDHAPADSTRATVRQICAELNAAGGPDSLSSGAAWDLADRLEGTYLGVCDERVLAMRVLRLKKEDVPEDLGSWVDSVHAAANACLNGSPGWSGRAAALRQLVQEQHWQKIAIYRRDRALIAQRGRFLHAAGTILTIGVIAFTFFYGLARGAAAAALPVALLAGAVGAILGRALRIRGDAEGASGVPLGIRSMMSFDSVLGAQPAIGAVSALFFFLAYTSGFLSFAGLPASPATLALLGFVAGFSEAALLGVMDRVSSAIGKPETAGKP